MDEKRLDEKRVEQMKQEYDTYPVPPEALERIKAGISQADREEKSMKKKQIYRIGKVTGMSAAAAMAAIVILANSGENVARAMEQIPVIGAITKVVTFRDYEDVNGGFEAHVEVPQITEEGTGSQATLDELNKSIEEYAQELITMYEHDLQASGGEGHYALDSSYEVIRDDEEYLAIRINSTVVMAGGNQFVKIFNVDKNTGKVLTLAELFADKNDYVTTISENIKAQMRERMEKDEMLTYFIYSEETPYGFEKITEEDNFYLNEENEIVLVFDEYEVAPGYMGVVEFVIPKDVMEVD